MILVLTPDTRPDSPEYKQLLAFLANLPGISTRVHNEVGVEQTLTEVYLIGNTKALSMEDMGRLPCVDRVVRISEEYRVLGGTRMTTGQHTLTITACALVKITLMCLLGFVLLIH